MAKWVLCALLRHREWNSRTGACPGKTMRQGSDDLPYASFFYTNASIFRGSSVADARLEPPRGVQREGKILAQKPSRPTEVAGMGEGLRSKECRDLVLSC